MLGSREFSLMMGGNDPDLLFGVANVAGVAAAGLSPTQKLHSVALASLQVAVRIQAPPNSNSGGVDQGFQDREPARGHIPSSHKSGDDSSLDLKCSQSIER